MKICEVTVDIPDGYTCIENDTYCIFWRFNYCSLLKTYLDLFYKKKPCPNYPKDKQVSK
jgi:hypothetical protein